MDASDDGYFYYNAEEPPLCIRGSGSSDVHGAILSYLQDSARFGLKHHENLLPCGLSAGEAAVMFFRAKPRRVAHGAQEGAFRARLLSDLEAVLGVVFASDTRARFAEYVPYVMRSSAQLTAAIKRFLADTGYKRKGYTLLVKQIVTRTLAVKNHS